MSTDTIMIYMPLLNEGTNVLRPVYGSLIRPNIVMVQSERDYDPEIEEWQFAPGSVVRCVPEVRSGQQIMVAREQVLESAKSA